MPPEDPPPDWPSLFRQAATLEQLRLLFGVWWTFFREGSPDPDAVIAEKDRRKAELSRGHTPTASGCTRRIWSG